MTTSEFEGRWRGKASGAAASHARGEVIAVAALCAVLPAASLFAAAGIPGLPALLDLAAGLLAIGAAGLVVARRLAFTLPVAGLAPSAVLIGLAAAWIALQASPFLPAAWTHPLWRVVAAALPEGSGPPAAAVSLDPGVGFDRLLALLRDAALLWLAYHLAASTRHGWNLLRCAAATGAALSAWALLALGLHAAGVALGLAVAEYVPDPPTGFATVANVAFAAALAAMIGHRGASAQPAASPPRASSSGLAGFLAATPSIPSFAALAILGAAVAAGGPGEVLALLIGIGAMLAALLAAPSFAGFRHRPSAALGVAALAAALLVAAAAGFNRMTADSAAPDGQTPYAIAAQAIADAPALGTGAGTFRAVLALYGAEPASAGAGDLLESFVELGMPAAFALILACAGLVVLCARGVWQRRRNAIFPALGIGLAFLVAARSIAGAALQNPLAALFWCILMGVACGQSHRSQDRHSSR
ncbi:MAG TPA: hypothetical protein VFA50_13435 [Stellaceae bacterium]|nr:hypothetical protein [Stellaceae bacterium]